MKTKLVLSTHKLATKTSSLLRSYCHLLKPQLHSQWIINNGDENSDVLIADKIDEIVLKSKAKAKIILSNCSKYKFQDKNCEQSSSMFQLCHPISSSAIIVLFNKISRLKKFDAYQERQKRNVFSFRDSFSKFVSGIGFSKEQNYRTPGITTKTLVDKLLFASAKNQSKQLKVVFLGRPAVGKTTAIRSISDKKILTSEANATDSVSLLKKQTTIGIDFGEYKLDNQVNMRLYGTPGQIRYDFVQNQTVKNSDIYIILININSKKMQDDFNYFNHLIAQAGNSNALKIVALTHADKQTVNKSSVEQQLFKNSKTQIKIIDPRSKIQVRNLLEFAASQL